MNKPIPANYRAPVLGAVCVVFAVTLLMTALGVWMRLAQGSWLALPADRFYQMMTAHGIGMVGIAGLAGVAIMAYFLRQYAALSATILWTTLGLFLIGVGLILSSVFLGGFAAAWTFLYPLPALSQGVWPAWSAVMYLAGVLVVGVGFLVFYLDSGWALIKAYGGLGRSLGVVHLFGGTGEPPPPTAVASTMVTLINVPALAVGATILVISLIHVLEPAITLDPMLAKNLIYFFGHTFINATIYMAIIAVYEIISRYTQRPWKPSKLFLGAWAASTVMVLIVYPHHLLMDFAMPTWMLAMGQIISYTSGLPVLFVTTIGLLGYLHGSQIRWNLTSSLLVLSVFGWAAGVFPAVVDATIVVNQVMHNTQWVPGHFHFYLLLGMMAMFFGFASWLAEDGHEEEASTTDRIGFWLFVVAGLGFVFLFLLAGSDGVPRRFAVHLPDWRAYADVGGVFAAATVAALVWMAVRFFTRVRFRG